MIMQKKKLKQPFTAALFTGLFVSVFFASADLYAQDTLKIDLKTFIEIGVENSGQLSAEKRSLDLANNRINEARANRYLPEFDLRTLHGLVPGVESDSIMPNGEPLPRDALFLDPDLENDFNDFALFTRFDVSAVQPVYTWGALNKAVAAAKAGATAAEKQLRAKESEIELRLAELYFSYLLALETERILEDANKELSRIGDILKDMREDGDPEFEEADLFKFEIFESEFGIQRSEVRESKEFVERVWNYVLKAGNKVYFPNQNFLDPVPFELKSFEEYQQLALEQRPELQGISAGIDASKNAFEAQKAKNFPVVFLGLNVSFATTPNRPRQSNPFIINNTNFFSAAFGFGVRQNLNIFQIKSEVKKSKLQYRRMQDLHIAAQDGIILELNNIYKEALVAESKVKQIDEALTRTKNWVRHEQLNYDIGFGNSENLIEAIRKELELRVQLKQNIFELNKKIAELYKAAGLPVGQLNDAENE